MPRVAVVIPMYNHNDMTDKCVEITRKNAGMECDIYVVDDGSEKPYENESVCYIRHDKNAGFTAAANTGILACGDRYDYIHLLNNDTEPEQDFLVKLVDVMEANPEIGIASSVRILDSNTDFNMELYGVDLIRGYQQMTNGNIPNDIIYCRWVPLCSSLIRHSVIREIGLLDKRMIMWCSDNDYCIRCNFAGYNVCVVMVSRVKHIHQVSTGNKNEAGVKRDQQVLLEKLSGFQYAELMKEMPLDVESQLFGRLTFEAFKK